MLCAVIIVPAMVTLGYSFTPEDAASTLFTLSHYTRILGDAEFLVALINTVIFVGASVSFHLLVGLAVALMLNGRLPARPVFRVIAILPWTVPDVIAAIVWRWILHPLSGPLNELLFLLGLVNEPVEWLGQPQLAMPALIFANIWRGFAFVMLILLAGLQAIPKSRYETAAIDGANAWQQFRFVTLPGIRKMIAIAVALDIIWEVRRFGLVRVMTNGGPSGATEILSTLVYKQYFQYFQFEYASATAIVLSLLLLAISAPYIRAVMRED